MSDVAIRDEDAEEYQFLVEQKEKAAERVELVDGDKAKAYYKGQKRIYEDTLEKFGSGELSEFLSVEYDGALDGMESGVYLAGMMSAGEKDAIEKIHEKCDVSIPALNKDGEEADNQ